ncbi:hypothetical protein SALBM135S_02235 [Streptomyces alboniger]
MHLEFPLTWRLRKDRAGSGALGDLGRTSSTSRSTWWGSRWRGSRAHRDLRTERPLLDWVACGLTAACGARHGTVTVDDAAVFTGRFPSGARQLRGDALRRLGRVPRTRLRRPPPVAEDFQQVTLAKGAAETGERRPAALRPLGPAHLPRRPPALRLGGQHQDRGKIPVYSHDEEGLQGIALDPKFKDNRAVYLYYGAPAGHPGR